MLDGLALGTGDGDALDRLALGTGDDRALDGLALGTDDDRALRSSLYRNPLAIQPKRGEAFCGLVLPSHAIPKSLVSGMPWRYHRAITKRS